MRRPLKIARARCEDRFTLLLPVRETAGKNPLKKNEENKKLCQFSSSIPAKHITDFSFPMAPEPRYDDFLPSDKQSFVPSAELVARHQSLKWRNICGIALVHIWGMYGLWYGLQTIKWSALLFIIAYGWAGGLGVTAGAHRLWSHRSYRAKWQLRVILAAFFYAAGLTTIHDWVRDHRVHHKFVDTSADPHDINRGFFFAHCGWIMTGKHPMVIQQGRKLDMEDILRDKVVSWCDENFYFMKMFFCFALPTLILRYVFDEPWWLCVGTNMVRYMISLNGVWSVNSVAHYFGGHPYDKNIRPAENWFVTACALGEGWHNYHHVFPFDYSSSEFGFKKNNATTLFINFFSLIGWARDLKTASKEMVQRHAARCGDGTY
ncbi:Hypothetical predicted protein [Cloeon dipterum]|uniref:Fatty acid desaturase domain-containing protein n=1 Tax=Cloeon dipterum TaxID=197152 RepID=A0A8S1D2A4_9INSE|nr:Hypothetical predicted protein [Cloeon dipterum]